MTTLVPPPSPLRLRLSADALVHNWRWLAGQGSAACGAAVKANGYGTGATDVVRLLGAAGCRDFFTATWAEALAIHDVAAGASISVLHGMRDEDMPLALAGFARPVLNTPDQVRRWRDAGGGACDVMIDTGMNRLGLALDDATSGLLVGLTIHTLTSHLATADEDVPQNGEQLAAFRAAVAAIPHQRASLANSAGICLGSDYHFDLTRPGLALYGGIPRPEAAPHIRAVVHPESQILQLRTVSAGQPVGYNATWRADHDTRVAIINLGYADGYLRSFSGKGSASFGGHHLPVIGRVSMDLVALALPDALDVREGDWVAIDYDLSEASRLSGLSPYELLTGLGSRYDRLWA
ncbi:alanine racemase [Sphingomonas lacunae]|uniref:alanine racemase n=1 Tax=Sphingomonas lacunae TaxID=2698828 RepID=A0A6M4AYH4_9SPHN|nr:alanine racemase [Sphingomonas lacunae]QJQ33099.1 alanine racemase [Sphingomonas lacunae]